MFRIQVSLLLFLALTLGSVIPAAFAEDSGQGTRTDKGYQVSKENYMAIPSDMQVQKIASNVIKAESDTDYMARKIEDQNKQIEELKAQMASIDARIKALEKKPQ